MTDGLSAFTTSLIARAWFVCRTRFFMGFAHRGSEGVLERKEAFLVRPRTSELSLTVRTPAPEQSFVLVGVRGVYQMPTAGVEHAQTLFAWNT